jgi:hypothetical protein
MLGITAKVVVVVVGDSVGFLLGSCCRLIPPHVVRTAIAPPPPSHVPNVQTPHHSKLQAQGHDVEWYKRSALPSKSKIGGPLAAELVNN